jgi:thiol-disulfide isomerase/thioredoxin
MVMAGSDGVPMQTLLTHARMDVLTRRFVLSIPLTLLTGAALCLGPFSLLAQTGTNTSVPPVETVTNNSSIPAESTTNLSPIQLELQTLVQSVQDKINAGKVAETDFTEELKHFDALLAKENGARSDEAAQIPYLKALLYFQVFDNPEKGRALVKQIKADYPDTKVGHQADRFLQSLDQQQTDEKIQAELAIGAPFPDFSENDLKGQPLSVGQFKGKVVLVDFWATWCPPCRAELPGVVELYKKYHAQGLEIVGVSLDSDRKQLADFLKDQEGMTWPQYIDGEGETNKLAAKYGVSSIPFTILVAADGKIIGKDMDSEDLGDAVAAALNKQ